MEPEVVTSGLNICGEGLALVTANSSSDSATLVEFPFFSLPDNRYQRSFHGMVWSCPYTSKQVPPCI